MIDPTPSPPASDGPHRSEAPSANANPVATKEEPTPGHVFVSYVREDEKLVSELVEALEAAGLNVWWDRHIEGGTAWRTRITEQLEAAQCVLVVWSTISVSAAGEFVHDEAARAKARGVLLPVRIHPVLPPVGFGERQGLDLVNWTGQPKDPRVADVIAAVRAQLEGGPRPVPKRGQRPRRWLWASTALGAAAATLGFVADVASVQRLTCQIAGVRPLCQRIGAGGVPSVQEEAAWQSRVEDDCASLRAHLQAFPTGAFAQEARARLDAADIYQEEVWKPIERRLSLIVQAPLKGNPSRASAEADAQTRADAEAQKLCNGSFAERADYKVTAVRAEQTDGLCRRRGRRGHACGWDGWAVCVLQARSMFERERCPER